MVYGSAGIERDPVARKKKREWGSFPTTGAERDVEGERKKSDHGGR